MLEDRHNLRSRHASDQFHHRLLIGTLSLYINPWGVGVGITSEVTITRRVSIFARKTSPTLVAIAIFITRRAISTIVFVVT